MASPGSLVSDTTLSLIVKQLQFLSQEISTLKQQLAERLATLLHADAVAEEQQERIDALEAQLSLRINTRKGRLSAIEASLARLIDTAKTCSKEGRSSSKLGSLASSTAFAHSESSLAAASAPPSKRARSSSISLNATRKTDISVASTRFAPSEENAEAATAGVSKKRKRSEHAETSASSQLSTNKLPSFHARSTTTHGFSSEAGSSGSSDADREFDCDDEDNAGPSFSIGGSSIAVTKSAPATSSSVTPAAPACDYSDSSLVSHAASAAWNAAIAAARARLNALVSSNGTKKSRVKDARDALSAVEKHAAVSNVYMKAAASRLDDATIVVNAAANSIRNLNRVLIDKTDVARYLLFTTWATAAEAAEDAALRWVAAAEVARDPTPAQSDAATGSIALLVSHNATAALTAAVAAARVRFDLARSILADTSIGSSNERLREAKCDLFAAEYRLAVTNPSAAAAGSILAGAKAARYLAQQSNDVLDRADREFTDPSRTLAATWFKATEAAVDAAEKWVAAAEAAEAQAPLRPPRSSAAENT